MDIDEYVEQVHDRQNFTQFLEGLIEDYRKNQTQWENQTLENFLEALRGWVIDMDGYFQNIGQEPPVQPSWNLMARMLLAATAYE